MAKHGTSRLVKVFGMFSQSSRRVFITICVFTTVFLVFLSWHKLTNTHVLHLPRQSKSGSNPNNGVNAVKLRSEKDTLPLKDTSSLSTQSREIRENQSKSKDTEAEAKNDGDNDQDQHGQSLGEEQHPDHASKGRQQELDKFQFLLKKGSEVKPKAEEDFSDTAQKREKEQTAGDQDTNSDVLKELDNLPSGLQSENSEEKEVPSDKERPTAKQEAIMERNSSAGRPALWRNRSPMDKQAQTGLQVLKENLPLSERPTGWQASSKNRVHMTREAQENEKVPSEQQKPSQKQETLRTPSDRLASTERPAGNPLNPIPPSTQPNIRRYGVLRVNETVVQGVARHNKRLQTLQATVDRLKQQQTNYNGQLVKNIDDLANDKDSRALDKHKSKPAVKENDVEDTYQDTTAGLSGTEKSQERNTPRPDTCQSCFHSDFTSLIDHQQYCQRMSIQPIVLLLISSAPDNRDRREAVRETWGAKCQGEDRSSTDNLSLDRPSTDRHIFRCLFVLGLSKDVKTNENVMQENQKHNDILQFSFMDAYSNLTYKTMSSLYWANRNCPDVPYVMKTDDDMFLNTELIPIMLTAAPKTNFIGGFCWGPSSPNRDAQSKWYVPLRTYVRQRFPPMCSGTGYIMSHDVVNNVIAASKNIPFFHLEDVYIALCLQKYQVRPVRIMGFNNMFTPFSACQYRHSVMSSHEVSPSNLRKFWSEMQQCPWQNHTGKQLYADIPYPHTD